MQYTGKVCEKHPELAGLRVESTRACVGCKRERVSKWKKDNSSKSAASAQRSKQKIKDLVFEHYGKKCSCCGFDDMRALSIDHTNQDGAEHRKNVLKSTSSDKLYRWLVANDFPKEFRTLCYNCQIIAYKEFMAAGLNCGHS